jgi:hypothetical protein
MVNSERKCVRNIIPRKTPIDANRFDWHNAYKKDLINMYSLFRRAIEHEYPEEIKNLDDEYAFHHFSRLIYHCSSKYICEYEGV